MGTEATASKIYAATKPAHDHARKLLRAERRSTFHAFVKRTPEFFGNLKNTLAINARGSKVPKDALDAASNRTPAASPRKATERLHSTGADGGESGGAHGVKFDAERARLNVGADGLILDR